MKVQNRKSGNVITVNSKVLLKEVSQGREAEVTITDPQQADVREGKISELSPIGLALLGRKVGDEVSWRVPSGIGHFEIIKIIPEAETVGPL